MGRRRKLRVVPSEPLRAVIRGLDRRAQGVGEAEDGTPVRVAGALPAETVRMHVEHVGRDGTLYGSVASVERPSPHRVEAPCPHFLDCGGCDLLHAAPEAQLHYKQGRVAEALGLDADRVAETAPSPRAFGYRALAKLVVGPDGILGSYRPRTHDVQDMRGCLVHAEVVERIADAARDWLADAAAPVDLRYLLIRGSLSAGRAVVTLVSRTEDAPGVADLARALAARPEVARVVHHVNDDPGDALIDHEGPMRSLHDAGAVEDWVGPVPQSLEAGAFCQINPAAAAVLYAAAVEASAPAGRRILDLYAGSGGVGLALLAAGARAVVAVEAVPSAVDAARAAAARLGRSDAYAAYAAPVEDALDHLGAAPFDVVVLNPPRKGAAPGVVEALGHLGAPRIVYVSCNPDSLARDVRALEEKGYVVRGVQPVDLFPHTRHVETVLTLDLAPA